MRKATIIAAAASLAILIAGCGSSSSDQVRAGAIAAFKRELSKAPLDKATRECMLEQIESTLTAEKAEELVEGVESGQEGGLKAFGTRLGLACLHADGSPGVDPSLVENVRAKVKKTIV